MPIEDTSSQPVKSSTSRAESGASRPVVIQRTITLRVDLRALAALGGALIIIGALLPWVTPLFQPYVRALGPLSGGGLPLIVIGILIIALLFTPRFITPRVSATAATFGFAAGLLAAWSALNTIGLSRTLAGDQNISPISGIGLGVYLTLAGAIIAVLAGLAPMPPHHEPARAEIQLWQPATAILAVVAVLCILGTTFTGFWLGTGGSTSNPGTPTPAPLDAGLLATPLINVEVNPLEAAPTLEGSASTPTLSIEIPTEQPAPTETPLIEVEPTFTLEPSPTIELIPTHAPSTNTPAPSLTPTQITSSVPTPTATHTPSPTPTVSPTTTPSATP